MAMDGSSGVEPNLPPLWRLGSSVPQREGSVILWALLSMQTGSVWSGGGGCKLIRNLSMSSNFQRLSSAGLSSRWEWVLASPGMVQRSRFGFPGSYSWKRKVWVPSFHRQPLGWQGKELPISRMNSDVKGKLAFNLFVSQGPSGLDKVSVTARRPCPELNIGQVGWQYLVRGLGRGFTCYPQQLPHVLLLRSPQYVQCDSCARVMGAISHRYSTASKSIAQPTVHSMK